MGVVKGTGRFIKRQLDVKKWVGYNEHKQTIGYIVRSGRALFSPIKLKDGQQETFADAVARLQLTDADIAERLQRTKTTFNFFMILTLGVFAYAVYLVFFGSFFGTVLALAVTAMIGVQAFKYHFWLFQMKHKKLGCTFEEWRQGHVNPPKTES